MNLTLVTDATIEPVSLDEAKQYIRLETTDDDNQIPVLIAAARLEAENENGRELARKQWKLTLDQFPRQPRDLTLTCDYDSGNRLFTLGASPTSIELLDPLITVDTFTFKKSDGTVVPMVENTDYIVDTDKHPGIVCPAYGRTWPTDILWPSSAVQITFTAGFAAAACPATVKQGIMLLVSQWYEGRIPFEAIRFVAELPFGVTSLFRNNKHWRF